jgi:hypothetical protein
LLTSVARVVAWAALVAAGLVAVFVVGMVNALEVGMVDGLA